MLKCKLSQEEIMKLMSQKMTNILTAFHTGDGELLYAECMSSVCSGDEFYEGSDEIRFSNDDELVFFVDGRKFWCGVCVGYGLSNKDRVIKTAERWKNGEHFGEISDKYVIWGEYKLSEEDKGLNPEQGLVDWYWGIYDLEPGAVVPEHIIDACKRWLEKEDSNEEA